MRAGQLKQWQLFYNTNNYLCLVYKIEHGRALIVNYNGTFYKANRDSEHEYSDEVPEETVEQFFDNFPLEKVDYYKERQELESIKDLYYLIERKFKLMLLC